MALSVITDTIISYLVDLAAANFVSSVSGKVPESSTESVETKLKEISSSLETLQNFVKDSENAKTKAQEGDGLQEPNENESTRRPSTEDCAMRLFYKDILFKCINQLEKKYESNTLNQVDLASPLPRHQPRHMFGLAEEQQREKEWNRTVERHHSFQKLFHGRSVFCSGDSSRGFNEGDGKNEMSQLLHCKDTALGRPNVGSPKEEIEKAEEMAQLNGRTSLELQSVVMSLKIELAVAQKEIIRFREEREAEKPAKAAAQEEKLKLLLRVNTLETQLADREREAAEHRRLFQSLIGGGSPSIHLASSSMVSGASKNSRRGDSLLQRFRRYLLDVPPAIHEKPSPVPASAATAPVASASHVEGYDDSSNYSTSKPKKQRI